ncbi:MAG: hypothetical protein WBX81_04740, partial [Nitrososphaeraceae archaeon]
MRGTDSRVAPNGNDGGLNGSNSVNNSDHNNSKSSRHLSTSSFSMLTDRRVLMDSISKLNPWYLAKQNPVMFTVEAGFFVVLVIAMFPNISPEFVSQNQILYFEVAIILILTVWFATFSESLSEAQARARVTSLRALEKEVSARKVAHGKEVIVTSTSLKPGDEVVVYV